MSRSKSPRPPSLKPALSRGSLQASSDATRLSVAKGFYRLPAGSHQPARIDDPQLHVVRLVQREDDSQRLIKLLVGCRRIVSHHTQPPHSARTTTPDAHAMAIPR